MNICVGGWPGMAPHLIIIIFIILCFLHHTHTRRTPATHYFTVSIRAFNCTSPSALTLDMDGQVDNLLSNAKLNCLERGEELFLFRLVIQVSCVVGGPICHPTPNWCIISLSVETLEKSRIFLAFRWYFNI